MSKITVVGQASPPSAPSSGQATLYFNNTTSTFHQVDDGGTDTDLVIAGVPTSRQVIAGDGLTGGGDLTVDRTFDVVANGDGSIVVNANDVQVGVLATDAQHGTRGGGTLHAIATTSTNGFLSAADKAKIDALPMRGFVTGCRLTYATASTITIGTTGETSEAADSTAAQLISFVGTITVDISTSGAGGLDTGSEAANTWYAVYLIDDSTDTNSPSAVVSLSSSSPTLSAGYDVFRRVGWVRNDAASAFRPFHQEGLGNDRCYFYDDTRANLQAVTAASNTSFLTAALGALMPTTSQLVELVVEYGADSRDYASLRPTGSILTEANTPWRVWGPENNPARFVSAFVLMPTDSSQQIDYAVFDGGDSLNIFVIRFGDSI